MKKLALIFMVLSFINPPKCNNRNGNTSSTRDSADQWSSWTGISTSPLTVPLKVRYRREDDLGRGNFAWTVLIRNDDLTVLRFTYKIEVKKGNGTNEVIEDSMQLVPGTPQSIRVGGANIVRVSATDVARAP